MSTCLFKQTYIASGDPVLMAKTIQAIGKCASTIEEVSDTCLSGLVNLLSNEEEVVVAESVVVIRKLLQLKVGHCGLVTLHRCNDRSHFTSFSIAAGGA